MMLSKAPLTIVCSLTLLACGSSNSNGTAPDGGSGTSTGTGTNIGGDQCPDLSGAYSVTTEIVSTTCRLGLHTISQPVTYSFVQTAPSCQFTMSNSLYSGSVYAGHFVMSGGSTKVVWDSVAPTPTSAGYALTYSAEDLVIAPGSLSGSFTWHSGAACDGITNVCQGSVPAGCPTPQ